MSFLYSLGYTEPFYKVGCSQAHAHMAKKETMDKESDFMVGLATLVLIGHYARQLYEAIGDEPTDDTISVYLPGYVGTIPEQLVPLVKRHENEGAPFNDRMLTVAALAIRPDFLFENDQFRPRFDALLTAVTAAAEKEQRRVALAEIKGALAAITRDLTALVQREDHPLTEQTRDEIVFSLNAWGYMHAAPSAKDTLTSAQMDELWDIICKHAPNARNSTLDSTPHWGGRERW